MKKRILVFLILTLCLFSVWCSLIYEIEDYKVKVVIGKDAVHHIEENITMNFQSPSHGFYRDIPVSFLGTPVSAKVRSISCSAPYSTEYNNGFFSMKIGDADRTVKGMQNYVIQYNYDLGIDVNDGYDEFYLDLLGDAWECSTSHFSYEVYLPKNGLTLDDIEAWVTTGFYGSSKQLSYSIEENSSYYILYGTASNLRAGQAVTMRIELPEGWYVGAREPWNATEIFRIITPYLSIVMVLIAFILWKSFGKDKTPIITARFEPPENFSPMVVGFLADGSVDDKDLISMIFNWADRGLMTINEEKKDKFSFTKLAEIGPDVPKTERDLFNSFFRRCSVGQTLSLTDIQNNNFYEAMLKAKIGVSRYFTKERALRSSKAKGFAVLVGLGVIIPLLLLSACFYLTEYTIDAMFVCFVASGIFTLLNLVSQWSLFRKWYLRKSNIGACILSGFPFVFSIAAFYLLTGDIFYTGLCCLSSFLLAFFAIIMEKKSEYGQKLFEEILGYREFIEKVSMDELKMMIDKDPDIYYRVLSYAVVLGLEEKWSRKFNSIAMPAPSWYIGSNIVDVMYYSRMIGRMKTVIAMNAVSQVAGKTVGGGGFHSSGFAGGGFGGGGGRAW